MIFLDIQYVPTLTVLSEEYESDNITIIVEWASPLQQAYVATIMSYSLGISPPVHLMFTGRSSAQLTILYNTVYNLSIVATNLCRPNATAFLILNYGEAHAFIHKVLIHDNKFSLHYIIVVFCGHPKLLPTCKFSNDSVPVIENYDGFSVEGSTIKFSCPPGLVLSGPSTATCTENGEWEPDPGQLICAGYCLPFTPKDYSHTC